MLNVSRLVEPEINNDGQQYQTAKPKWSAL